MIEYQKIAFVKTHNLEKLYKKLDNIIEVDYEQLELINELYIESRYPGDMGLLPYGKPSSEDAREFYEFAKSVFGRVCKILKVDSKVLFQQMKRKY